eukprot:369475_1
MSSDEVLLQFINQFLPYKSRIHNIFHSLYDGLILLQILDKLKPGCVNWTSVCKKVTNNSDAVNNCSIVMILCQQSHFMFSLSQMTSIHILKGNKEYIRLLLNQMRDCYLASYSNIVGINKSTNLYNLCPNMEQISLVYGYCHSIESLLTPCNKHIPESIIDLCLEIYLLMTPEHLLCAFVNRYLPSELHINDIYADLCDGYKLLMLLDALKPGIVQWSKATKNPANRFNKMKNGNYVLLVCKISLNISISGMGALEIVQGDYYGSYGNLRIQIHNKCGRYAQYHCELLNQ